VEHFEAGVIGSFNAINIAAAILVAHELGMDTDAIKKAVKELKPIEHRLQRIDAGGKVILDDSFNGNVDGMSEAIEICRGFDGTKVIVTPGLVEASVEDNKKIATKIDEVFDLVILTGSLNIILYDEMIKKPKKIILQNKAELVNLLAKETKAGELIYFANDAPSYI
jgi:UDP-N-acetylmuramoyl-tripeptide--D-alanyl-D-alanine ligase